MADQFGSGFVRAERRCTDVLFLVLFVLYALAMLEVTILVWSRGNPARLTHGMDSAGNLCGLSRQPRIPAPDVLQGEGVAEFGVKWEKRRLIWFPATQKVAIKDALKLGICVDHCPTTRDTVRGYGADGTLWPVLYDSAPVLGRCVPQVHDHERVRDLKDLRASLQATAWILWFVQNVWAFRWVVGLVTLSAVGLCFVWTALMTVAVRPLIHLTLTLVATLLAGAAYLVWMQDPQRGAAGGGHSLAAVAGTGALLIVLALYLLLLAVLGTRINIAADVVKLASKVMLQKPSLLLVPVGTFAGWLLLTAWWLYTTVLLNTTSSLETADVQLPQGPRVRVFFASRDEVAGQAAWLTLFGYFWATAFLSALTYTSLAFAAVFWYFSAPGDHKVLPPGALWHGVGLTARYHLGTLAFGALFVGLVQMARAALRVVEEQCRRVHQNNTASPCVLACARCCLAGLERVIRLVNHNAFVITCIDGTGFCASAEKGMGLVLTNAARVGTTSFVVGAVLFLIRAFIAGTNTLLAGLLMNTKYFTVPDGAKTPALLLVGLITYVTSSYFMSVFHTVIDTVLLCVLVDEAVNDGAGRPYFMTSDLLELTRRHNVLADPSDPAPKYLATGPGPV